MARVTNRDILIEAIEAIFQLGGNPVGCVAGHVDSLQPHELRDLVREHARIARERIWRDHEAHCAALKVILDEAGLVRPGLSTQDEMAALLDTAKKLFRQRRDSMHEADAELRRLDDAAWLAANATAGDPVDQPRLARARRDALERVGPSVKKVTEIIDTYLFGFDADEECP